MPVKAGQSEIIQASQKDEEYKSYFRNSLGELFKDLSETQSWIKWKEEIGLIGDIIYYGVTTLSGYQTLGEEYCSLIQVDKTGQRIPTKWQRSTMILTQVVIPYVSKKFIRRLEQTLQCTSTLDSQSRIKNIILILLPLLKQSINVLHQLHLATFYFSSIYYDIATRVSQIQYILARGVVKNDYYSPTYRVLGWVTLLHFIMSVLQLAQQSIEIIPKIKDIMNSTLELEVKASSKESDIREFKCTLCLERLHDMTATICGHLFCWYCINEWCRNKAECPLCREDLQTQQLVYLHHFHPT
ncbi:peroxisome biogenesis factor 10-like [Dendronephthya gigantea]|uniref:peroxisome biogenesis factor 10-like n=1 Tax=Dendronephthya gigantea TaxID=151771 RepID=UPI00106BDBD7|nr:peroxisome biogenesis factor 10-like [Dendronephthya gigantea]